MKRSTSATMAGEARSRSRFTRRERRSPKLFPVLLPCFEDEKWRGWTRDGHRMRIREAGRRKGRFYGPPGKLIIRPYGPGIPPRAENIDLTP